MNFFGSPETAVKGSERDKTLGGSISHLLRFLETLPDEPETRAVMVLSSYNTWMTRSITYVKAGGFKPKKRRHGKEDDHIDEEEDDAPEEVLKTLKSYCPGCFGAV